MRRDKKGEMETEGMKELAICLLVLACVVAFSVAVMAQSGPKDSSSLQTTSVSPSYAVNIDNTQGSVSGGAAEETSGNCWDVNSGNGDNLPPCCKNLQSGQNLSNQLPQDGGNAYPRAGGSCCGGGGATGGTTSGANNVVY
jgi:hypothetical protein